MNFFAGEGLPEYIVLHVMDYLDNSSLLNLAKCNKSLKELSMAARFASRFTLHLNFMRSYNSAAITVTEIEAIHLRIASGSRKYENLRVLLLFRANIEDLRLAAFRFFRLLGDTVKEVTIDGVYGCHIEDFSQVLLSLRNDTKYKLLNFRPNKTRFDGKYDHYWREEEFDFMENVEEIDSDSDSDSITMRPGGNAQTTETKISAIVQQTIGKPTECGSHTEVYPLHALS